MLILGMGTLILCFTKTARGDIDGAVFDHLTAANPLTLRVITSQSSPVSKGLRDFMVEYHIYTATLSVISMDVRFGKINFLNLALVAYTETLMCEGYRGRLCGCWLSLLLLIPRAYRIGRQVYDTFNQRTCAFPSADNIVDLILLQNEVTAFSPPIGMPSVATFAVLTYKQALHIYVWTLSAPFDTTAGGSYTKLVKAAASEALQHLENIPANSRVNTSLCWPLAVIGSIVELDVERAMLTRRLENMVTTITLGNIQVTLDLLKHVWEHDLGCSPWVFGQVMQDRRAWISFA